MPTLKPLPECEGPKLECFTDDLTAHDFKILEYLGAGCHSCVLKAEIDGEVYAIKFFFPAFAHRPNIHMFPIDDFWLDEEPPPLVASSEMPQHVIDSLRLHATSFNNECRAYGRLKELGREDLAIKAHGYIRVYLNDQIEEQFQAVLQEYAPRAKWTFKGHMGLEDGSNPIMAIVKDWVPDHRSGGICDMTREARRRQIGHLPRMLRNLRELHKCGIVVRDLKTQQYYEGQLGDLSHAWTVPHIFGPEHGIRPRWTFASMAAWDLKCFQKLLDLENSFAGEVKPPLKPHNLVAWRNDEVYKRLRPRAEMHGPFLPMLNYDDGYDHDMTHYPPYDPAQFDWKAVGKSRNKKTSTGGVSKKRKVSACGKGEKGKPRKVRK